MKRHPVIIDVDTGVDDAHALLLALKSTVLEVLGITTIAGNVDVEQVVINTLKVLDFAEAPSIPVARGFNLPLIEPTHFCPRIHGNDGLGDLGTPPSSRSFIETHAVNFIINILMNSLEPVTLITLAPLTNIAVALRMEPRIKQKIDKIVMMAGAAFIGGNSSPWAEANIYYDPEAAHIVFTSGVKIIMYTWDVYLQVQFTKEEVEQFVQSPNSWANLSGQLMEFDMKNFNCEQACIGDAGAVASVILPEAIKTNHMHVSIELQGKRTRGMTVVDARAFAVEPDLPKEDPNVFVVVGVNVEMFKDLFRDTLLS